MFRVYSISQGAYLAQAAGSQSSYLLDVASSRGLFTTATWCRLPMGNGTGWPPLCPGRKRLAVLLDAVPDEDRDSVIRKLEAMNPFVCRVLTSNLYAKGINVFEARQRYDDDQLAAHIVGLVDPPPGRRSGIELACEDTLSAAGGSVRIRYQVDAPGAR